MRSVLYCGVRGRIGRSAQRSFFTHPPLPPGLSPAPAASDAKPFFKTAAEKHISGTSSSLDLSSSSQTLSSTTTTTTIRKRIIVSDEAKTTPHAERKENVYKNNLKSNNNNNNTSSSNVNTNNKNTCSRMNLSNSTSSQSVEQPKEEKSHDDAQHQNQNNNNNTSHRSSFLSPETFAKHVPTPAKFAASLVADALNLPPKWSPTPESSGEMRQEYREHCVLGWSPHNLYHVVADVAQYSTFLPWCLDSIVHHVKRLDNDEAQQFLQGQQPSSNNNNNRDDISSSTSGTPMEMLATLTVGFSFFKEKYTSRVFLVPDKKVQAVLNEGGDQRRNPVLSDLHCVWEFNPVPGNDQQVEVRFVVSFAFKNPLHSKFIMSHVVSLMTRSFEKHCEKMYGPPSCERERLTL